jgi:hypothetical protein
MFLYRNSITAWGDMWSGNKVPGLLRKNKRKTKSVVLQFKVISTYNKKFIKIDSKSLQRKVFTTVVTFFLMSSTP